MKELIYLIMLLLVMSCGQKTTEKKVDSQIEKSQYWAYEEVFSQVDSLLKIDNSEFWNYDLKGPILIVDPNTRIFVSNENNENEDFSCIGKIFTDTLPNDVNIANTAIDWGNKRWTMLMAPLPQNEADRNNLIIHELFHRIQPDIGFEGLSEANNSHLDTYEGRVLLRLELEALKEALKTNDPIHVSNALTFRFIRQSDTIRKLSENSLELNEGLAEYTGVMLSGRRQEEMAQHFIDGVNSFYQNQTFVRSFAYHTIPIYGYVLSEDKPHWHRNIRKNTVLTDYFMDAFSFQPLDDTDYILLAKQNNYNYQHIIDEEKEREKKRSDQIKYFRKVFLEEPTLDLPFRNMSISFDPTTITPLEGHGNIYSNVRVVDEWGTLLVDGQALIAQNWSGVKISQPLSIKTRTVKGEDWVLELSEGWQVLKNGSSYVLQQN